MTRTFGIEEEFFLVDPETAAPVPMADELSAQLLGLELPGTTVHRELLASQLEIVTGICTSAQEAVEALVLRRAAIERICREHQVLPFASGTALGLPSTTEFTKGQRYATIHEFVPGIAREHFINGLHIHVHVPDAAAGVRALNALRGWLPLIAGMGANSPIWNGEPTGFASWRTVHYRRWSAAGIPPAFATAQEYQQRIEDMITSGALLDPGHIGWFARLSVNHPTIEVRAADTQMAAGESVALALLIRAIVDTASATQNPASTAASEVLDLGLWQAAKSGVEGTYFDSEARTSVPAKAMIQRVLDYAGRQLQRNGDEQFVADYLDSLANLGNGATRQLESWNQGGAKQVVADAAKLFAQA
ncbi:MAG: YbdK family carboxylate-amine ligase [Glutamicibacter sp.]|uniref:carboxylate-amine ligase n=1 Tax=Glutamicibacter sp. TaxID=1931995 RepID=UPI002FCB02BF